MNHGQIPGYIIYKVYDKKEIESQNEVKETKTDYPSFFVDSAKSLFEMVGEEHDVDSMFVKRTDKGSDWLELIK
jgi:hypothetical protein